MNTLAHLCAMLAILWLSIFCFQTLDQRALGVAVLLVFLLFIPLTFFAAMEDWQVFFGNKREREQAEEED